MPALLTDEQWEVIKPLLPPRHPSPKGGRRPVPDRQCLQGILFVLRSGVAWQLLPTEMGCGAGSTCWRRFRDWTAAGVWAKAHAQLVQALGRQGLLNLERAVADCASLRAQKGGRTPAPTPPTAGKEAANATSSPTPRGVPLVVRTGPANQREEQWLIPMLKALPPVVGPRGGRPRRQPKAVQADRGYGFPWIIRAVRALGIRSLLAPRGAPHGSGLGTTRYVVERTLSWFGNPRRLKLCDERTGAHFQAFHELAACTILANRLRAAKQTVLK
jgi:transposase